jgi:hypothetical protein
MKTFSFSHTLAFVFTALPFLLHAEDVSGTLSGATVTWDSPKRIIGGDVIVPVGTTLTIAAGTDVQVQKARRLVVNGVLRVEGTSAAPVVFGPVSGAPMEADPASAGLPFAPPKWGGIQFVNTMSPDNWISYAQISHAQTMEGGVGLVASRAVVDHCNISGTHWRGIYANASALTVQYCTFANVFGPTENAVTLGIDNVAEQIKAEGAIPAGHRFLIYRNSFGTNKGHNDVIDVDSGTRPAPIVEIRENFFVGCGDELCDLGGDVLLDGNFFQLVAKDPSMANGVFANAISTGDPGNPAATVVCTRNVFWDVDHCISCRVGAATIFEHNTVVKIHPDFVDVGGRANTTSAISLRAVSFNDPPGDGCYLAGNIFWNLPRVIGAADSPSTKVSKIEATRNFVSPTASLAIGTRPQNLFSYGAGNLTGDPLFVDESTGDFHLAASSPARLAGVMNRDAGAYVPTGAWLDTQTQGATTQTNQSITVGGPGIFAYRWRMVGSTTWSAPVPIGEALFSRVNPTQRTATLALTNLAPATYRVEVIGQDFAGQWQDEQTPTLSGEWTVLPPPPLFQALGVNATDDPDSDGLNNLLEYAFGLPLNAPSSLATTLAANGQITFTIPSAASFPSLVGASDLSYEIRTSPDLVTWTTIGEIANGVATPSVTAGPIVGEKRTIQLTAPPQAPGDRQFMTIRVTLAP